MEIVTTLYYMLSLLCGVESRAQTHLDAHQSAVLKARRITSADFIETTFRNPFPPEQNDLSRMTALKERLCYVQDPCGLLLRSARTESRPALQ